MNRNSLTINASERRDSPKLYAAEIIIRVFCAVLIFLGPSISNVSAQTEQTTCIPYAQGVPGALWGQPPNWWDTSLPFPQYYNKTDDPRWRGAVSHTYGGGAGEQVTFRALYDNQNSLYLSWRIDADPTLDPQQDALYVGFKQPSGAGDVVIYIVPYENTNTKEAAKPFGTTVYLRNSSTGGSWITQPTPNWLQNDIGMNYTGVWLYNTSNSWAIQMKVPNSTDLGSGIKLGKNFSMWFEVQMVATDTVTGNNLIIPWKWPRNVASKTGSPVGFPPNSTWGNFTLGTSGQGCGEGVSISWNNIGTLNTPSHQIKLNETNTFFARPFNNMSKTINPYGIYARFRIANWGSQPIDSSQFWSSFNASFQPRPNYDPILPNSYGNITIDWTLNETEKAPFISHNKPDHQCMLVELSGPNLTFINNSVYRNMDFVHASNFSRDAEISVKGLPALAAGNRDVYLYVQTTNMPSYIKPEPLPPNETIWDEQSTNSSLPFSWNASNFRGFNIDGIGTETLRLSQTNLGTGEGKTRTIGSSKLSYNSTRQIKEFEVSRNKDIPVEDALDSFGNPDKSYYMRKYYAQLNLFGEPYVAMNGDARYLSRLILEQNASEEKTLSKGEGWNIGDGWVLTVKSTGTVYYQTPAPTSSPVPTTTSSPSPSNQATLELSKDGRVLDTISVPEGEVYTYSQSFEYHYGSSVPVFVTYVDNVTVGKTTNTARLKYTWAVSLGILDLYMHGAAMNARASPGYEKEIGVFRFTSTTGDYIYAENFKEINLTPNNIIPLANNLNFKVTNDKKYLRFYPATIKTQALEEMPAYRVFVYHDTGEKTMIKGVNYTILRPQTSFGYYVKTDEDLGGWKTALQGAQLIAPNFYKLGVPNNGSVIINTAIETLEPGADDNSTGPGDDIPGDDNPPSWWPLPWWPVPWWFWVLLLIIIVVVILLRRP